MKKLLKRNKKLDIHVFIGEIDYFEFLIRKSITHEKLDGEFIISLLYDDKRKGIIKFKGRGNIDNKKRGDAFIHFIIVNRPKDIIDEFDKIAKEKLEEKVWFRVLDLLTKIAKLILWVEISFLTISFIIAIVNLS